MSCLDALLQTQALDRLPRSGWCLREVPDPETVAAHSLGTALIALALGPRVDPPLDVDRAVSLAVLHDVAEARIGDLPAPARRHFPEGAKAAAEAEAAGELLRDFPAGTRERCAEALEKATREARFVSACDDLQLGVRLLGYVRRGVRGLDEFRETLERASLADFAPCEELRREILEALDRIEAGR